VIDMSNHAPDDAPMKTIRVTAVDQCWMLDLDGHLHGQFATKAQASETALQWASVASAQGGGVRVLIPSDEGDYQVKVFTHAAAA